ncbi:MAG TPA: N-acetylmuramoyl-L-alanine amidase [Steroidobacteraceae bacterium]|nr:N-acetylmuramoyl-L-alanine amidase [Steroidobacteraceae bacterium]
MPSSSRISWRMGWVLGLACAAFGSAFGSAFAHASSRATAEVRGLELAASHQGAALTIELSRPTSYRLFTLENPHRIVIDLQDTERARSAHLPRAAGIVQAVRAAARPHGALRLVLQLGSALPAHVRWSARTPGATPELLIGVGAPISAVTAQSTALPAPVVAPPPDPLTSTVRDRAAMIAMPSPPSVAADRPVSVAHAPIDSGRNVVVAVDAGHGGKDSGAIGPGGTQEKNVVLGIALALAARIDAEPGMHAVLTRDTDEFLLLQERRRRARVAHADLFVSVHADSSRDSHVSGASVYVLSERGATDESARWLAERENSADELGRISLADKDSRLASVLLDLSNSANISASMTAAQGVLGALRDVGEVRKPQVQQAGFVVLKSPDIPSMLVETAYISNPSDERRLRAASEQHKLAEAIFEGLRAYFEKYPPAGTRFASQHATGTAGTVLVGAAAAPSISLAR